MGWSIKYLQLPQTGHLPSTSPCALPWDSRQRSVKFLFSLWLCHYSYWSCTFIVSFIGFPIKHCVIFQFAMWVITRGFSWPHFQHSRSQVSRCDPNELNWLQTVWPILPISSSEASWNHPTVAPTMLHGDGRCCLVPILFIIGQWIRSILHNGLAQVLIEIS